METVAKFIDPKRIVEVAESFVGQKEISGNMGFEDASFEKRMKACGWEAKQAWCAYFTELVFKTAIEPDITKWKDNKSIAILETLFSASAVKTFEKMAGDKNGIFTVSKTPKPGDLIVYQTYNGSTPDWTGHIGIVKNFADAQIRTFEGNTNSKGGREGIEVAPMKRVLDFSLPAKNQKKLVLLGFITLK